MKKIGSNIWVGKVVQVCIESKVLEGEIEDYCFLNDLYKVKLSSNEEIWIQQSNLKFYDKKAEAERLEMIQSFQLDYLRIKENIIKQNISLELWFKDFIRKLYTHFEKDAKRVIDFLDFNADFPSFYAQPFPLTQKLSLINKIVDDTKLFKEIETILRSQGGYPLLERINYNRRGSIRVGDDKLNLSTSISQDSSSDDKRKGDKRSSKDDSDTPEDEESLVLVQELARDSGRKARTKNTNQWTPRFLELQQKLLSAYEKKSGDQSNEEDNKHNSEFGYRDKPEIASKTIQSYQSSIKKQKIQSNGDIPKPPARRGRPPKSKSTSELSLQSNTQPDKAKVSQIKEQNGKPITIFNLNDKKDLSNQTEYSNPNTSQNKIFLNTQLSQNSNNNNSVHRTTPQQHSFRPVNGPISQTYTLTSKRIDTSIVTIPNRNPQMTEIDTTSLQSYALLTTNIARQSSFQPVSLTIPEINNKRKRNNCIDTPFEIESDMHENKRRKIDNSSLINYTSFVPKNNITSVHYRIPGTENQVSPVLDTILDKSATKLDSLISSNLFKLRISAAKSLTPIKKLWVIHSNMNSGNINPTWDFYIVQGPRLTHRSDVIVVTVSSNPRCSCAIFVESKIFCTHLLFALVCVLGIQEDNKNLQQNKLTENELKEIFMKKRDPSQLPRLAPNTMVREFFGWFSQNITEEERRKIWVD